MACNMVKCFYSSPLNWMKIHKILIAFETCSFTALPRISSGGRVTGPGKDVTP